MPDENAIFMTQWVVYKNPADYPGQFVVRRHHIMKDRNIHVEEKPDAVAVLYEIAIQAIPQELTRIPRMPGDEPQIYEVWL